MMVITANNPSSRTRAGRLMRNELTGESHSVNLYCRFHSIGGLPIRETHPKWKIVCAFALMRSRKAETEGVKNRANASLTIRHDGVMVRPSLRPAPARRHHAQQPSSPQRENKLARTQVPVHGHDFL